MIQEGNFHGPFALNFPGSEHNIKQWKKLPSRIQAVGHPSKSGISGLGVGSR
jgi:hypothetical protein